MSHLLKVEQMLVTDHCILYSQYCIFATLSICGDGEIIAGGSTDGLGASLC